MNINVQDLKKIVVGPGHISEKDFLRVEKKAKQAKEDLLDALVDEELIKDTQLGILLAEFSSVPFVDLKKKKFDDHVFFVIPEVVARSKKVIAFGRKENEVHVAMMNVNDLETKFFLEKRLGQTVQPFLATARGVASALLHYKGSLQGEFEAILRRLKNMSLSRDERDEAAVSMVDTLLQYGYQNKASDIHIEPYRKSIVVRFRIDGIMHDVLEIPKDVSGLIITRVKILSKLRTDEHRSSQDGKLRFYAQGMSLQNSDNDDKGDPVDVRVSIVPVTGGENVVMRLLSEKSRRYSLTDIGMLTSDLKKVQKAVRHPHGMILVTGPTGSGKTTTLYSIIKILNRRDVHIATIEDPVEYDIEGVSQIQVNTKTNLTFAKGLRSLVRQDPDIIMVGEIRDSETARIAVNSAMTGHLVLSTMHANNAATTLPRLFDMGVEPFLVASTVNVVVAQRLVRKICVNCRVSTTITPEQKSAIVSEPALSIIFSKKMGGKRKFPRFFFGKGCASCGNTGYSGRIGVFEVLEMFEKTKDMVVKQESSDHIMAEAKNGGMTTMLEDGVEKVLQGITTLEEVLRVTRE